MKAEAKSNSKQTLKSVLVVALALVILALGVRLTMTAFTANDFLKAVNTTEKTENLFTSDLLVGYSSAPDSDRLNADHQAKALSSSSDTVSFDFNIYNYLLNDTTAVNTNDVFYTLEISAEAVSARDAVSNDALAYSIKQQGGESKSFGMNGSATLGSQENPLKLAGNAANSHHFTVSLPTDDVGKVAFVIKAVVQEPKGTTLNCLAAKIVTTSASEVSTYSLTKELVAAKEGFKENNAAYNYRITVTGEGKQVKLIWPNSVELDPFFDSKFRLSKDADSGQPAHETNSDTSSVTFYLEPGTHTINFYQVNLSQISDNKDTFEKQFDVVVLGS